MVNDIIVGMAEKIRTVYPSKRYRVYTESVEQGLREPCFFIMLLNCSQKPVLGNRYREDYFFAVHYFPIDGSSECMAVAQELTELLEYVPFCNDIVRGKGISSRIEDGILIFLIEYSVYIIREKMKDEYMEEVKVIGKAK